MTMTIEALVNLTAGTLQNTPSIQSVEGATVFPSKVEHGDIFFSNDAEEIEMALKNGAYAIVYEGDEIKNSDPEVAWIKVPSIEAAAFKLLRYAVLEKEAEFVYLSERENTLLKMILLQKNSIVFISDEWKKAFEQILNAPQKLFVSTNKELLKLINPSASQIQSDVPGYPISDTLFKSTFKVDGFVYQDRELAPFHLDSLLRVAAFCKKHDLPYSIERLRYTKHFMPVFIDGTLKTSHASKSDKVVIFTDNLEDIEKAREYLKYNGTWVKSIVLTPPKTKIENLTRPYWFETEEEVREILKNTHFNYAFIYTLDRSILNQIKEEYSLF